MFCTLNHTDVIEQSTGERMKDHNNVGYGAVNKSMFQQNYNKTNGTTETQATVKTTSDA